MTDSYITGNEPDKKLRTDLETVAGEQVHTEYVRDQRSSGTWGYHAGTSGTLTMTGTKRVLAISAVSLGAAGSYTINGGDSILIPYNATDKSATSHTFEPRGNLIAPEIIFTGTSAFTVEWVTG